MAEWLKAHAWKACIPQGIVGSNPTLSAINPFQHHPVRLIPFQTLRAQDNIKVGLSSSQALCIHWMANHALLSRSGPVLLTLPTSFETSKASISSAGNGRKRSSGGREGSVSRSSQRS